MYSLYQGYTRLKQMSIINKLFGNNPVELVMVELVKRELIKTSDVNVIVEIEDLKHKREKGVEIVLRRNESNFMHLVEALLHINDILSTLKPKSTRSSTKLDDPQKMAASKQRSSAQFSGMYFKDSYKEKTTIVIKLV